MALDRFRDALRRRDRVNHLSQKLALVRVEHLLVKFGVLERNEADEIKDSSKSGEERIRRIIEKLLTKDSQKCFEEFAKVVHFKNASIAREVFPFVDWSQESNQLRVTPLRSKEMATAPSHPDVIWLCSDREAFAAACNAAGVSPEFMPMCTTPSKTYNYYVVPSDEPVSVWVFCPSASLSQDAVARLLKFYNQVKYCVFTGRCSPESVPTTLPEDVLVAWQPGEFRAELQHMTALWRLTGAGEWTCPNVKHNRVVFALQNQKINFPEVVAFLSGSEEACKRAPISCATVLSCQVGDSCSVCEDGGVAHAVSFSHQLINYLVEKLVLHSVLPQY